MTRAVAYGGCRRLLADQIDVERKRSLHTARAPHFNARHLRLPAGQSVALANMGPGLPFAIAAQLA